MSVSIKRRQEWAMKMIWMEAKLKIKATIEAPPFDDTISSIIRGSISWSVNDETGLDLSANALTRINRNILISEAKPQMVTYLVIKPNSLNGLHDYTFTLTYSSTIHNYTASSSITVRANSPPSMGQVDVIPVRGEELETVFEIGAYLWEDSDLPLTYEPYIRDPYDLANVIVLQTRSEMTSVSTKLPAGYSANSDEEGATTNNTLNVGINVYDSLEAYSSTGIVVQVSKRELEDAELVSYLSDSLTSAASDDDAKLAVVTTGLRTNIADCSNAPNCTLLHRKVCSAIPHTCGECKDDYIGALGPSNSICASAELFLDSWTSSAANDDDYYNDDDDYDYNDANASATRRLWSFHQSRAQLYYYCPR